ncbi:hypothetical protein A0H81_06653 [Grifola frondosa]|uniref:Uncharacterized protein n=1 Tax=Grifola frondosa TaxID=5627 RepID=A0A1C7M872_GRIFR|nr:hypothetical protein A0H81_06653 [Grifola frondosa]
MDMSVKIRTAWTQGCSARTLLYTGSPESMDRPVSGNHIQQRLAYGNFDAEPVQQAMFPASLSNPLPQWMWWWHLSS